MSFFLLKKIVFVEKYSKYACDKSNFENVFSLKIDVFLYIQNTSLKYF